MLFHIVLALGSSPANLQDDMPGMYVSITLIVLKKVFSLVIATHTTKSVA